MRSKSFRTWAATGAAALDRLDAVLALLRGAGPEIRAAEQQILQAYIVSLASHFQRFCRDIHSESVDHLIAALDPPRALLPLVRAEFTRDRKLDRGNAHAGSIGPDFGRLRIRFEKGMGLRKPGDRPWTETLEELNTWRNAIVHQDFGSDGSGSRGPLTLGQVRGWRVACKRLARTIDGVVRDALTDLTGRAPW